MSSGHGHVRPRPDGTKAWCGGPAICRECQREAGMVHGQRTEAPLYPLDMSCGTCHCKRLHHYQTYAGDAGCTRVIGTTNPVPCACTGFMATVAPELVEIHQSEMARRVWRAACNRQNSVDAAKYHAISPGIETKDEMDVAEAEFQAWLDGDPEGRCADRPPFLDGWKAGRRYEKHLQSALARVEG